MASKADAASKKLSEMTLSDSKDKTSINYFNLKMNAIKKTEMYVKFAKVMIIAQGAYSVERALAFKTIKTVFKYASCVISEETFRERYTTKCSPDKTDMFYAYFRETVKKALEEGNNLVVIDSTMSDIFQNRYYAALAHKMQYVLLILPPIVMKTPGNRWPEGSLADSFRVEASTVVQPVNMFKHLFCAWYLHDIDSHELRHLASLYVQDCMQDITGFSEMIIRNCPKQDSDGQDLSPIDSVRHYYYLVDKRQDIAYCAVKVFGDAFLRMNEYFKREHVVNTYGKMSKLLIAGFVLSKSMIAARVKLTHEQKNLWELDDELEAKPKVLESLKHLCPSKLSEESKQDFPDDEIQLISSKSCQTLVNTGETIYEPLESIHPFSKGRACHIVLGKAIDAPPCNVDYDVQFALKREKKFVQEKADIPTYDLANCIVKRVGQYWFIYLKEMYRIDAFFASCVKPNAYDESINC